LRLSPSKLLTLGLLLCLASGPALASDWPQWRGPSRSGVTAETGFFSDWPPKPVWNASAGEGFSSVVVASGTAVVMSHTRGSGERGQDIVFAVDAATGKKLWFFPYDCLSSRKDKQAEYFGPRATPVIDGGRVYTLSLEGHLHCLDLATGKPLWDAPQDLRTMRKNLKGDPMYGFCASPVIHDNLIICSIGDAVIALDKMTGKALWRCKGGDTIFNGSSPVVVKLEGKSLLLFGETSLVAASLDPKDNGKSLWTRPLDRAQVTTPVVDGASVFFSTYPNTGKCGVLKVRADGVDEPVWENTDMQSYNTGNPVLADGYLYGVDCARTEWATEDKKVSSLKCIDFKTGKVMWTKKEFGWAQVVAADGKLLVLRESGELVLLDASSAAYTERGRAQVIQGPCWAIPALSGGRIYVRNNKGDVVCVSASGAKPAP
jgi:outer membrane protein assembly factor BamB